MTLRLNQDVAEAVARAMAKVTKRRLQQGADQMVERMRQVKVGAQQITLPAPVVRNEMPAPQVTVSLDVEPVVEAIGDLVRTMTEQRDEAATVANQQLEIAGNQAEALREQSVALERAMARHAEALEQQNRLTENLLGLAAAILERLGNQPAPPRAFRLEVGGDGVKRVIPEGVA